MIQIGCMVIPSQACAIIARALQNVNQSSVTQSGTLAQIGSVIRNPEIMDLVPYLLAAIADPNHATKTALEVLLQTVFVNTIDAASLVSMWTCPHVHLTTFTAMLMS